MPTSSSRGSPDEVTAKFVLDVDPDNIVKAVFGGGKSELACSFGLEIPRPALDDTHNEGIRHALDAGRHLFSGDALQSRDLLAHSRGETRHGEVAARTYRSKIEGRRMQQETDRRTR